MAILITPQAEEDIWEIWQYIARDNRTAADQVERDFLDAIETIGDFPGLGSRARRTTR